MTTAQQITAPVAPPVSAPAPQQQAPMAGPDTKDADLVFISLLESSLDTLEAAAHGPDARSADQALLQSFHWALNQIQHAHDTGDLLAIADKLAEHVKTYYGTATSPETFWINFFSSARKLRDMLMYRNKEFGYSPIKRSKKDAQVAVDVKPQGTIPSNTIPEGAFQYSPEVSNNDNAMEVGNNKIPAPQNANTDGDRLDRAKDCMSRALDNLLRVERKTPLLQRMTLDLAAMERKLERVKL